MSQNAVVTRAALGELRRLWRLERDAASAAFRAQRDGRTLKDRVHDGLALRDLDLDETDPAPGNRVLLWLKPARPAELEGFSARAGEPVRLWLDRPDEVDAVAGVLGRRRDGCIAVIVDGHLPERFDDRRFHLDLDAHTTTFDRGDHAIRAFVDAPARSPIGELRAVLYGERAPEFDAERPLSPLDAALNEPQRAAVSLALAARDLSLVFGPPGTGKTRTVVELVRQAVARGERVLVTAASNTAVDNLAERLVDLGVDVVRLGHPVRVSAAMQAATLEARLEASGELALAREWSRHANAIRRKVFAREARGSIDRAEKRSLLVEANMLSRDARQLLHGVQRAIVHSARVVAATAAGADSALIGDEPFDRVVLDEATQAADPLALAALSRGRIATLAGDPRQLPPTVVSAEASRAGLSSTYFERLAVRSPAATRLLTVQHRMHAQLMAYPSESMYEGRLVAAPSVAGHTLADLGVADDPDRAAVLAFIDTAGAGFDEERDDSDPSTSNPGQSHRVVAEVRRLLARGLPASEVAVIAPYQAQVRRLRSMLATEVHAGLEVGSIDGFQGREKEAIVLDLVRSNPDGHLGFLTDLRRMNVAITRARRFLLIVGDSATVGAHPYFSGLLDVVQAGGGWHSVWETEA